MCLSDVPLHTYKKENHRTVKGNNCLGEFTLWLLHAQKMQDDTWESHAYRCPICMQIFSEECTTNMTPLIVCPNIHTVCRNCCNTLKDQQRGGVDAKCPQCRVDVWKNEVLNREKIYFLTKSMLACGSCSNDTPMSCGTARQHARECAENHITCPLLNNDVILSRCTQGMNISALWEHCQKFHILEGAPGTMQIRAQQTEDNHNKGTLTATILLSVGFDKNSYFFFTITTDKKSYNMCLHLTKEMPRDGTDPHDPRHSAADTVENPSIFFILRRFFPELEISFGTILMSLEVGSICGMLLQIPAVVSSYEDTTMLKNMQVHARCKKIVQVPLSLLRQMITSAETSREAQNAPEDTSKLKIAISLQIYFSES